MQNLIFLTGLLLFGNAPDTKNTPFLPAETLTDVAYGEDARQTMDIYLPEGRDTATTKLMILVHGGGWVRGDKSEFNPYITALQQRLGDGYAFANINYRLFDNGVNKFPAQENDLLAAVNFLMGKRTEYGFSKNVVLVGASAGAHLVLLQGYKNNSAINPRAIISFFGPADLEHLYNNPSYPAVPFLLSSMLGGTPETKPEVYRSSSPINFVTPKSPPTLLLHGAADNLVPVEQSRLLNNKLKKAGVKHDLVIYPEARHGWRGRNLEDSFNKIKAFLDAHVQ